MQVSLLLGILSSSKLKQPSCSSWHSKRQQCDSSGEQTEPLAKEKGFCDWPNQRDEVAFPIWWERPVKVCTTMRILEMCQDMGSGATSAAQGGAEELKYLIWVAWPLENFVLLTKYETSLFICSQMTTPPIKEHLWVIYWSSSWQTIIATLVPWDVQQWQNEGISPHRWSKAGGRPSPDSLHCQCMRGAQTLLNLENLLSYTNKIHVLNVKTISQNTVIYIIALKNLYKIHYVVATMHVSCQHCWENWCGSIVRCCSFFSFSFSFFPGIFGYFVLLSQFKLFKCY